MTATTEAERRAAEVIRRWADQIAAARRDGDHLMASQYEGWLFGAEIVLSMAGFNELALAAQRAQDADVHDLQTYLLGDRQDAA